MKMRDYTGQRYGKLTILRLHHVTLRSVGYWHCRCDCGNEIVTKIASLRYGSTTSCGCERLSRLKAAIATHGLTGHYIANVWHGMLSRCYDTTHKSYHYYGGRGITVCDRWRLSAVDFYADMGDRPSPDHSIDRIDPNGNYEPGNCRWATKLEQIRNRRNTRRHEYAGESSTIYALADKAGLNRSTVAARLKRGWTVERALETPIRPKNPNGAGRRDGRTS